MGSWSPGAFGNDAALDYVGSVCDTLMKPVNETLKNRKLGSTYLHAVAAIAILTEIARITPVRPWDRDTNEEVDAAALRAAFLALFDEKFNDEGDPEYRRKRREALVMTLDAFVKACT